jgi:hypothetical protein
LYACEKERSWELWKVVKREKNEEKSMSMEKKERKKERKNMWKKKMCVNERKKNEWKRKRERWGSNKDMRGMNQVKEKKIKSVRKDVMLLRDENFILFPTMCNPTTMTSSVPCSHNFLLPLHMSTILNLLILDTPTYG